MSRPHTATRPPKPRAYDPLSPKAIAAKIRTIPQPAPLPKTEAEIDAVLARCAPPAKPKDTWSDAFAWYGRGLTAFARCAMWGVVIVELAVLSGGLVAVFAFSCAWMVKNLWPIL